MDVNQKKFVYKKGKRHRISKIKIIRLQITNQKEFGMEIQTKSYIKER